MNFFKKLRNRLQKNDQDNTQMGTVVYMTDDLEHARRVQAEHPDICVEYHSCSFREPSPIHIYVMTNGRPIAKQNPEYIEYLRKKNPDMSAYEIYELMREASNKKTKEWFEKHAQEWEYENQEYDEIEESTTIEESKQKLKK